MEQLLSLLLHAAKVAQVHHWKCKSFAKHLALGELYDALSGLSDDLAEMYMGKYGSEAPISTGPWPFDEVDPNVFVTSLFVKLEELKPSIPQDGFITSKYEELQGAVSRVKYKLDNLR